MPFRARLAIGIAAAFLSAAAAPQVAPSHHATGSFDVSMTFEAQQEAPGGGVATARMGMRKTFSGDMEGVAIGTMLSGGTPAPGHSAAYVAIDQFHGSVDGRTGGFMLVHRGTMAASGESELSVVIAPDSGTGALAGITGTLTIDVREDGHFYDLEYRLPEDD